MWSSVIDKDCILLSISTAVKECCRQININVSSENVYNTLCNEYNRHWNRLQRTANAKKRGQAPQDDNPTQRVFEKEALEYLNNTDLVQVPGVDVYYNLSFFIETRYKITVVGRDENDSKKCYNIRICIDPLEEEDRVVRLSNETGAFILQTISSDKNVNHCRLVVFKYEISNTNQGPLKISRIFRGPCTNPSASSRDAKFLCYDKQIKVGPKSIRYPAITTEDMKSNNTKWKVYKVVVENRTPCRGQKSANYYVGSSDSENSD